MDYLLDGKALRVPSGRLVMFWAGIPHRTVALDRGPAEDGRQCNVYLPLDTFLHMPRLGRLTEIGALRRNDDGRVRVATVWHADTGFGCGTDDLANLLRDRGRQ